MLTAELAAERFTFSHEDEAVEEFHARRWTDGLPIVLPTVERVRAMVAASGRHAAEVIGVVPPRWAEATVENIAINAVMAGCLPQYERARNKVGLLKLRAMYKEGNWPA